MYNTVSLLNEITFQRNPLALLIGWQEGYLTCKNPASEIPVGVLIWGDLRET